MRNHLVGQLTSDDYDGGDYDGGDDCDDGGDFDDGDDCDDCDDCDGYDEYDAYSYYDDIDEDQTWPRWWGSQRQACRQSAPPSSQPFNILCSC